MFMTQTGRSYRKAPCKRCGDSPLPSPLGFAIGGVRLNLKAVTVSGPEALLRKLKYYISLWHTPSPLPLSDPIARRPPDTPLG